eukprot:TRINITY_DN315_c0_g1_i1.p1 TRINITY_DN315_c0_g1~~TRINITY_DN315_c0_g1_i1.p1  ORF type:complete len:621 (+),score=213.14 TRINITY_DN315_c0_g1_i1:107-1969(+)
MQRQPSVYERFSDAQVQRFKQVFLQFDVDGNGHIDEQELHDIMGKLGRPLQPGEAKKYIEMVDIDGSGVIYFEEFLQLLEMQQQEAEALRQYSALFRQHFNRSGSGHCTAEELRAGMLTVGHKLTDQEVEDMILEGDQDGDRKLSFEEFAGMLHRVQTEDKPVSKRGWDQARIKRIFDLWAAIIDESPKLAEKNSTMMRCERPNREYRRPSKVPEQKTRNVAPTSKMLQPDIASSDIWGIVSAPGADAEGEQAVYTDPIIITTEGLSLIGGKQGRRGKPRIEVKSKSAAVTLRAKRCWITNFEIINHGPGPAIQVDEGYPDITGVDCHGGTGGILIRGRAHPVITDCTFRDHKGFGIRLQEARAIIEKCTFSSNSDAGVVVERSSNPWISDCTFTKGRGCGVLFDETANGVVCHCDINQNGCPGVLVTGGANPILWKNEIHHGDAVGISVTKGGRGLIEANDLHHNAEHDIEISDEGNPVICRNTLHDGDGTGVFVEKGGRGSIEANEILHYRVAGVKIQNGGAPAVLDNTIVAPEDKHGSAGIAISEGAQGKVLDNMIIGWVYRPRASVAAGVALFVGGKNEVLIKDNVARGTEEECRAERMVLQMGKHDLRSRGRGRR